MFAGIQRWSARSSGTDLVAYVMIGAALLQFTLFPPALPAWRYWATIAALLGLVAIHALPTPIHREPTSPGVVQPGSPGFGRVTAFMVLHAVLYLIAFALGASGYFSFIPFLLFLLVGQATWIFPPIRAAIFVVVLFVTTMVLITMTNDLETGLNNTFSLVPGIFFTVIFTLLASRAVAQTARVEGLLAELRTTNAELEIARARARDLGVADERVRLAREIHDGLGHHLTVLAIQLQAAEKLVARDPERAASTIAVCRREAQTALEEVRRSVAALRPASLDAPLTEAIKTLVRDFGAGAGIVTQLRIDGTLPALAPAASTTLYRAVQEGLTNAQRHGAASEICVALASQCDTLHLHITDNGHAVPGTTGGGHGLAGLRERASNLGGRVEAGPRAAGGYQLDVWLPLA